MLRKVVGIVGFVIIFLSSANVFGGNDTIPSSPQTAEEWFRRGNAACSYREYEEAIFCYEQAIKLKPDYADAYCRMGLAYHYGRKDYDKAVEFYNKSLELNPNDDYPYYCIGNIYMFQKQNYDKAIECFKKAVELNPHWPFSYYNLGTAYGYQGDQEKEMEYQKKAARLGHEDAQDMFRRMGILW